MQYCETITLKDGRTCILRNGTQQDAQASLDIFIRTHAQTDYLLTYPDEITFTAEQQAAYLQKKSDDAGEIEILAFLDGTIVGTAGVDRVGTQDKLKHRAEFGISIDKAYWGLGIGRALALYRSEGFTEFGRNPQGFLSRLTGRQELVYMRREL